MNRNTDDWLNELISISEREIELINRMPDNTNNSSRWTELFTGIWPSDAEESYIRNNPVCLCLTGPCGADKYTIAENISGYILKSIGTFKSFFRLSGSYISENSQSASDVRERIQKLFDHAYPDADNGTVFVIEELQECSYASAAAEMLALNIRECKTYGYPICVICIAEKASEIPAVLSRQMRTYSIDVPDSESREGFLANKLLSINITKSAETDKVFTVLSEALDGCSYKQMDDVLFGVELLCNEKNAWPDESRVKQLVNTQVHDDNLLNRLYAKAIEFLENPPQFAGRSEHVVIENTVTNKNAGADSGLKKESKEFKDETEARNYYSNCAGDVLIKAVLGDAWAEIQKERAEMETSVGV